jgi:uncharacterized protein (DUF362 family)
MNNSSIYINNSNVYKYPNKKDFFSPSTKYPEYKYNISSEPNPIYDMVRTCFYELGYDKENYETENWNPLGKIINNGDTVIIKPNMVMHENLAPENGLDCLITNPSLVRAVLDYVIIALNGSGKVIIGDAPVQSCDFQELIKRAGYDVIIDFYKKQNINVELVDFRNYISENKNGLLIKKESTVNESIIVDLKNDSSFSNVSKDRFKKLRITNYNPSIMYDHHNEKKNEYLISKDILSADVIINMPKPKTHRKAGVTIALKNMVGINTNKEWLPHHTTGPVSKNGDEYKENSIRKIIISKLLDKINSCISQRRLVKAKIYNFIRKSLSFSRKIIPFKDCFSEGSWYGNDTIWRTIVDLNKIIFYADKNGMMTNKIQRKMLIIADMIISGEGDGPLRPSPKKVGIIAVGENPVIFDKTVSTIMGFDYKLIPSIYNATNYNGKYTFNLKNESIILSNNKKWNGKNISEINKNNTLKFKTIDGWKDIER